jgi:hypothetical protein
MTFTITVSRELGTWLEDMITQMLNSPNFTIIRDRKLNVKESEELYSKWCYQDMPSAVRSEAMRLSLFEGSDAMKRYLKAEFFAVHPELKPNGKMGRPEWYITAKQRRQIAAGEVVLKLAHLSGMKLYKELEPRPKLKSVA